MGVGEERAARGEAVHVRRLHLRMPSETADPVVLIVNGEEEDVGLRRGGGRAAQNAKECEKSDEEANVSGFHSVLRLSVTVRERRGRRKFAGDVR